MRSLVAEIEKYLKELIRESSKGWIEISRKELAKRFACVPSQITYVINTRFDIRQGYLVESRRGGGGYIRICRLCPVEEKAGDAGKGAALWDGGDSKQAQSDDAQTILNYLARQGVLTEREFLILASVFRVLEGSISHEKAGELNKKILREVLAATGMLFQAYSGL